MPSIIRWVPMGPGWTELTRMPSCAYWMAAVLENMRTAPLEVWYTTFALVEAAMPIWEEMLMMEPPAGLAHLRHGRGGAEEDTGRIHRHDAVPEVARRVLDGAGSAHCGVVDEDVQRPELPDRRLYGATPLLLTGDVQGDVEDAGADGPELGLQCASLRIEDVAEADAGPLPDEDADVRLAEAAGAAADECHLPLESHAGPPSRNGCGCS